MKDTILKEWRLKETFEWRSIETFAIFTIGAEWLSFEEISPAADVKDFSDLIEGEAVKSFVAGVKILHDYAFTISEEVATSYLRKKESSNVIFKVFVFRVS